MRSQNKDFIFQIMFNISHKRCLYEIYLSQISASFMNLWDSNFVRISENKILMNRYCRQLIRNAFYIRRLVVLINNIRTVNPRVSALASHQIFHQLIYSSWFWSYFLITQDKCNSNSNSETLSYPSLQLTGLLIYVSVLVHFGLSARSWYM